MFTYDEVLEANIALHTAAASRYAKSEPHFRTENVQRVDNILKNIREETNGIRLLDIGCGSGFIIDIADRHFPYIRGVDITPAMAESINPAKYSGDVKIIISTCENMPFNDDYFDVCTAHAVLHHLHELEPAIHEAFRVLKPGGIFYSDLDPNYYFWDAMIRLQPDKPYAGFVMREIAAVKHKDEELANELGVSKETVQKAESLKHVFGGFKEDELLPIFKEIGFSAVQVKYEWFLGEANIMHGERTKESHQHLRQYLQDALPLTKHLFKYVSILARK